jgi:hypothetical protein
MRRLYRFNDQGEDVTRKPHAEWRKDDWWVLQTTYATPEQTSGQHTNGPPRTYVRRPGDKEWRRVEVDSLHKLRLIIARGGL